MKNREMFQKLVDEQAIPPFVYTYPTRSSYRPLDGNWTIDKIWLEDTYNSPTNELNVYIHVPFCRYKCGFCNLYTVISEKQTLYDAYTDAICRQLEASRSIIEKRDLRTIYIGGGTPSLLARQNFDTIFNKIDEIYPNWRGVVDEVCIEAAPDSIVDAPDTVKHLMWLGLTRINLGVQSLKRAELKEAGRSRANEDMIREAIAIIQASCLPNLSTDLIMGFMNQTDETWRESVIELVKLRPDTISTYFLTVRPDAWFSSTGFYRYQRAPELYDRYDFARDRIKDAGYVQESNVRYKLLGKGGYRQKVLQFRGVPILGIGVGARTYTNTVDYLIGGGPKPSLTQVYEYIKNAHDCDKIVKGGFEYTDEERIRKRLVLHLFDIDLEELERYEVSKYPWVYEDILEACIEEGFAVRVGESRYQLTPKGYKYRDIISWTFFSEKVLELDREFYTLLHSNNHRAVEAMGDPAVIGLQNVAV
jgi:oxygen-independent coproporphyrinogen-3 oxidase